MLHTHLRFAGPRINMKHRLFHLLAAVAVSTTACSAAADSMTGPDKPKHAAASAALTLAGLQVIDRAPQYLPSWCVQNRRACAAGTAALVGVAKELHDSRPGGSGFSKKDIVANVVGIGASLAFDHWVITPRSVTFNMEF